MQLPNRSPGCRGAGARRRPSPARHPRCRTPTWTARRWRTEESLTVTLHTAGRTRAGPGLLPRADDRCTVVRRRMVALDRRDTGRPPPPGAHAPASTRGDNR
ncbi:hypothetical protein QJS66_19845 [Kocuria rhizophila]|nr:hypothetical protein QJS66_19845 [Kocuria rhizophila]